MYKEYLFKSNVLTSTSREVNLDLKKLARLYHPDNWNPTNVLSKFESEKKFKELANTGYH